MILVDTSVWIDHLRAADATLQSLLNLRLVLSHPFVIGELAMGNLKQRSVVMNDLQNLPSSIVAEEFEVLRFITDRSLFGQGVGYIDAHLLASVRLMPDTMLWTRDRRMHDIATRLSIAFEPSM